FYSFSCERQFATFYCLQVGEHLSIITATNLTIRLRSFFAQIDSASEDASPALDANDLFSELKEKTVENKPKVIIYKGGAVVEIWIFSILIGVVNFMPISVIRF
ncbi:hypothetical protein M8C21_014187, partial [Ambrosia artemisiifolia]